MSEPDLADRMDVSVELRTHDAAVVRVGGEVDYFTAEVVKRAIDEATTLGVQRLLIDLDGVTFFGSAGLGVLVQTRRRVMLENVGLALVCTNKLVLRPLELAGLMEQFVVRASAEGAFGLPLF